MAGEDRGKKRAGFETGGDSLDQSSFCTIIHEILQEFVLIFGALRDIEDDLEQSTRNFDQQVSPFLKTLEEHLQRLENMLRTVEAMCSHDGSLLAELQVMIISIHALIDSKEYGLDRLHRQVGDVQEDVSRLVETLLSDTTGWGVHVETAAKAKSIVDTLERRMWRLFALLGVAASVMGLYNFSQWVDKLVTTLAR